jgi:zinc finger protein
LNKLFEKLDNLTGYTIILDDPCGNSYVDGALDVVRYERSFEQNEELGLNDIKTENYK